MGQTGSLTVRPTSAIRRYEKEDAESLAAGRQLKVDAVLEGTWQRAADRFRIRVHLLRVDSGATLWAETFDVAAADVFGIEDRVSRELADRLRLRLDTAERARLTKRQTSSPAAYEYYTKGVYAFGDRFDSANVLKSIDLFQQAVAADPRFALAHAKLGYAYAWRSIFVDATPAWLADAKQALEIAERLEPRLPQVHLARSFIAWSQFEGWQVEEAIRELQRARQIDPNVGHIELAELYWHIGLEEQAFREHELAIEQDPASDAPKVSLINEYYLSARPDEGLAAEQRFGRRPGARYYIEKRLPKEAGPLVETDLAQQPTNPGVDRNSGCFSACGDNTRKRRPWCRPSSSAWPTIERAIM
jgi:tetratricopeptide (TPR) repeat protein